MENTELKSKKRKRKHTSELVQAKIPSTQENDAQNVLPSLNGTAKSEPHKKMKKKHGHQDKPELLDQTTSKLFRGSATIVTALEDASVEEGKEEEEEVDTAVLALDDVLQNSDDVGDTPLASVAEKEGLTTTPTMNTKDASTKIDVPSATALSLPSTGSDPTTFKDLKLSSKTMQAISEMNFENMTEIQSRGIPPL